MSGMNSWLASIYGTDGADDLEKTAQAHLLQKLAQEENVDLSQFSEEELQALLQEVMGQQVMQQAGAAPQQAGQQGFAPQAPQAAAPQQAQGVHPSVSQAFAPAAQPQVPQGMPAGAMQQQGGGDLASMQKEAQAKFEEADLLGRVMAHAYTQELEKIASAKMLGAGNKVEHAARSAGRAVRDAASKVKSHAAGHAKGVGLIARKAVKENPRAAKAVGAAAGAGAAFAAGRMSKSKEASAFEKLAEMHAADILGAAGFDPATGQDQWAAQAGVDQNPTQVNTQGQQDVQGQQFDGQQGQGQEQIQEGTQEEQFAAALDERSLQMLADAGYDVNDIIARVQYAQQNQGQGQA